MNYYERYVGDYQKDTGNLSCCEVGAYDRLLDHYYGTELPLPSEISSLNRICRAMDEHEKDAVQNVANLFFPIMDDGMRHNKRADEEIIKAQARIRAAKENGKKGGRPPKENPIRTH
jgi:uncharacterized protein YdaU (DUF1376 family)